MRNQPRGLAPLIIVGIVAVVLVVVGVGGYFGYQAFKKNPAPSGQPLVEGVTEQVEEQEPVNFPSLFNEVDFTGTGLTSAEMPSFGVSGDFDLSVGDFDFSAVPGFTVELSAPKASVSAPDIPDLTPADFDFSGVADQFAAQQQARQQEAQQQQQQQAPPAGEPPAEQPPSEEPPAEPPPQSQVNAANCAQFASMPSASYCDMVGDPNGVTLCQQCKAAGY